jgi:hypothetical protein
VGPQSFALIIGAMKSGTTSLFELLAQHPQISACRVKEPRFFSIDSHWAKGWDWYSGLWAWKPSVHRIALEASPNYTTYPARPGVPERIASIPGVSFRFIYIMRNPLDQIESHVRHTLYLGGKSLDDGVPDWMIDTVRYASQIDRFLAVFPEDSLLLLTLDEFQEDPEAVLGRVCRFLGVEPDFRFEHVRERYNRGDAYELSPQVAAVVKAGPARWLATRLIPRGWRHAIRSLLPRLAKRKASLGRYVLSPSERAAVVCELEPELRRLSVRFGIPVDRQWRLTTNSTGGARGAEAGTEVPTPTSTG